MKRLLIPLLAAIALPTAVNARVDPEVHKLCLPAADYKGCVEMMSEEKTENKTTENKTKVIENDRGFVAFFNPEAVVAKEVDKEYGRYINLRYRLINDHLGSNVEVNVDADCEKYKGRELFMGNWQRWKGVKKLPDAAIGIIDEFCPQMDRLVKEAKSGTKKYYRYTITVNSSSLVDGGSGGGNLKRIENEQRMKKIEGKQNDLRNELKMEQIQRNHNEVMQQYKWR
tara:strand:+ start:859 stop:1539 length:681 start_codon:yes stop_codon:yes gene_type:complete